MTVKTCIVDGYDGTAFRAGVTSKGELRVATREESATSLAEAGDLDTLARLHAYSAKLADPTGSEDLRVDGSTTPVVFAVEADADSVIHVQTFKIVMACTQMALASSEGKRFGPYASGLTNGILVQTEQGGVEINVWQDPIKRLVDFLYYTDVITNIAGALGAGVDLTVVTYYFHKPVVLVPQKLDKLKVTIQDDLTDSAFDEITALISGWQESTT